MEDRLRAVCAGCGYVDYVNPTNVVGTVPIWGETGEQVLLCLRNIEPRKGFWTLPAGFLELGETITEGAARETREEAGARIEVGELYTVLDVLQAAQVHLFFRARLLDQHVDPGAETVRCKLFHVDEIPWETLSFRTVVRTLQHYVQDRVTGHFPLHTGVFS